MPEPTGRSDRASEKREPAKRKRKAQKKRPVRRPTRSDPTENSIAQVEENLLTCRFHGRLANQPSNADHAWGT